MLFIILLSFILAIAIVIGVFRSTHWLFNLSSCVIIIAIFITDLLLFGWHEDSFKILLLCFVILIFESIHGFIKMKQQR